MGKQVLDIEQMKHLQELGLDTSNASMALIYTNSNGDVVDWENANVDVHESSVGEYNSYLRRLYGAFTLQDILDLLPLIIEHNSDKYELRIKRMVFAGGVKYAVLYEEQEYINWYIMQSYDNLIDAAYEMLCWCIENGYVETNKED